MIKVQAMPTERTGPESKSHLWLRGVAVGLLVWMAGCQITPHQEQKEQAKQHWDQVRAKLKYQLATQQFKAGEMNAATSSARESLGLDPSAMGTHVLLSKALLERGDLAEAKKVLQAAVEMDLESPELWYMRGVVAERCGRLDQALTCYRAARQLNKNEMDYLVAEAECLVAAGQPEEARRCVHQALLEFDRDGTLDVLLAEISLVMDDDEAAAAAFRQALPLADNHDLVAEEFGLLLLRMRRFAEAVSVLQPLVDRQGDKASGMVVRALAKGYLELGHADLAAGLLKDLLEKHPDDTESWFLQAQAALAGRDLAMIRRCLNVVRRLAPANPQTHLMQGYLCWRQGDLNGARASLQRCLAMNPNDVLTHCLIGQVLLDSNEPGQARHHWRRALQIDPRSNWAKVKLEGLFTESSPGGSAKTVGRHLAG